MRRRQNAVLSALKGAKRFIADHVIELTRAVDCSAALKRLDEIIASFITYAVDQDLNDRETLGETAKQRQLHERLATEVMRPIAEIARRNLRTTPEFKALRMPRQLFGRAFLASARGMAGAAA
jgi:hypothetical protein